jgi:hypothetical protein
MDAERATRIFQKQLLQKEANKNNLLITKYYVKILQLYDEYQIGIEPKVGYSQLLEAIRLNDTILVKQHKHTKETIRLQLNKMHKFKQFMNQELFTELTSAATRSHRLKPEMISVLRALALKYSELGDYKNAL